MATIKSYRELLCWQHSVELRRGLIEVTERPHVRTNFTFCAQVGQSARSAPANIAEGFKRSNRVFINYLDIAIGSLQESENHVDEALERKYVAPDEHERFRTLAKRAIRAAEQLRAYLRRCTAPPRRADARSATRPRSTNLANPTNPTNLTNPNQPDEPDRTRPNPTNPNQPDEPDRTRPNPTNPNQPDETRPNPTKPDRTSRSLTPRRVESD
jgi:four helix bundle protein